MFEDAHYRWKDGPVEGEYELQFDRFESSGGADDDQAVLIIVNEEKSGVGEVILSTTDVPGIDQEEAVGTAIFYGILENRELVRLTYDSELSEQRQEKARKLHDRVRSDSDDENETK
jgi:hypothetical protein